MITLKTIVNFGRKVGVQKKTISMPIREGLGHAIVIQETKNWVKTIISVVQISLTGMQPGCC